MTHFVKIRIIHPSLKSLYGRALQSWQPAMEGVIFIFTGEGDVLMCIKLRENIINYVRNHPVVLHGVCRDTLKGFSNEFCEAYQLDSKKYHLRVVATVIELYERGKLILAGGILQVPSVEMAYRLGQHQKGVRKRHCRVNKVRAARVVSKPKKSAVSRQDVSSLFGSEEGLEQLDTALWAVLRPVLLKEAMDEQFEDWKSQIEPVAGCYGSFDDLAVVDEYLLSGQFALIR